MRVLYAFLVFLIVSGCNREQNSGEQQVSPVLLGVASSFAPALKKQFEQRTKLQIESSGSFQLLQRSQQLQRNYQLLILADQQSAASLPAQQWHEPVLLAESRLVLALAASESVDLSQVSQKTWSRAAPELAPLGRQSLALVEFISSLMSSEQGLNFRENFHAGSVFPDAALSALSLETGRADQALVYFPMARSFGLKSVELFSLVKGERSLSASEAARLEQLLRVGYWVALKRNASPQAKAMFDELTSLAFRQRLKSEGYRIEESPG